MLGRYPEIDAGQTGAVVERKAFRDAGNAVAIVTLIRLEQ